MSSDQVIYEIKFSNGLFLASLLENSVNQTSTSLTLYGRGANEYGQELQQNLVKLLENFAFTQPPINPLVGQHWYNTAQGTMNYFNGTTWITTMSTPGVAAAALVPGQLPVVDAAGVLQYVTLSGDVEVNDTGIASIVTPSVFTLQGDIIANGTQAGKSNLTLTTAIAPAVVGLVQLSSDIKEHAIHGSLRNVVNGRQFIMMKVPHDIALTSLVIHSPIDGCTISIEYNSLASDGDVVTGLTYTGISTMNIIGGVFHEQPLITWIASGQGISLDISGVVGTIDTIDYTLIYNRV